MRKLILFVTLVFMFSVFYAQQEAQYTQYMVNPFLYNPALSGCEDFTDIKTGYRNQWTGIDGAPRTFYVSGHGPIGQRNLQHSRRDKDDQRHSVGGVIGSDRAGDIRFNSAYASYSYTITLSKGKFFGYQNHRRGVELALGSSFGVKQYQLDLERIQNSTTIENVLLNSEMNNKLLPDFSLGSWLYLGDFTYLGLSAQQLLRNRLTDSKDSRLFHHYNFVAGTEFMVAHELKILPSIMLKKVIGAPLSLDVNCRVDYQDKYFGGVSIRRTDAIGLLIGTLIQDRYEVAYSYDITTSGLKVNSRGSHEIILGLRFYQDVRVRNAEDSW